MPQQATIIFGSKVENISVIDEYDQPDQQAIQAEQINNDILIKQMKLTEDCMLFNSMVSQFQKFAAGAVIAHKEQIAALAVKIAEKIIGINIKEGNYNLTSIITETLNAAPQAQEISVYLNGEDLQRITQLRQQDGSLEFPGVQFKPDASLKKCECRVETAKGTVNYLISEHLERIEKALEHSAQQNNN
jgi:flagellar biosynthesis/type III secretory pathway protein FliH